eukprot:1781098-Rhodomonas_salina.2
MSDGTGYRGGYTGTWIGQTTKFMLWQLTRIQRVLYLDNDVVLVGSIEGALRECSVGRTSTALLCARKTDSAWNRAHWCSIYFEASVFILAPSWSVWRDLKEASFKLAQGPFIAEQHDGDPNGYCQGEHEAVVTEQDFMNKYFSGRTQLFDDTGFDFVKHCKPWPHPIPEQVCSEEVMRRFREALSASTGAADRGRKEES